MADVESRNLSMSGQTPYEALGLEWLREALVSHLVDIQILASMGYRPVRDFCVHVPLKECPTEMGLTMDYNPLSYEMWGSETDGTQGSAVETRSGGSVAWQMIVALPLCNPLQHSLRRRHCAASSRRATCARCLRCQQWSQSWSHRGQSSLDQTPCSPDNPTNQS